MACQSCDFKGFIETFTARDAGMKPMISQCLKCRDVRAYSQEIQKRLGSGQSEKPRHESKVIQFPRGVFE